VFRIECLCQWLDTTSDGPFPTGTCGSVPSMTGRRSVEESRLAFCVDVAWDRSAAHIGVAGWRSDGVPHVEIVATQPGTDWVAGWFTARASRAAVPVAVQGSSAPATSLIEMLCDAGLEVVEWTGVDLVKGTGDFYDRVAAAAPSEDEPDSTERGLRHRAPAPTRRCREQRCHPPIRRQRGSGTASVPRSTPPRWWPSPALCGS